MRKPEKMIVYNLFPLLSGRFTEWERHLVRASEMGFNWIFVNPIHLPGSSGSLYSIKNYFSFNPLLIDPRTKKSPRQQVEGAIRSAGKLGMRMMIELVVNHCAFDSDLIQEHHEWFEWEEEGKVDNQLCDENGKKGVWKDLGKLDNRKRSEREGIF